MISMPVTPHVLRLWQKALAWGRGLCQGQEGVVLFLVALGVLVGGFNRAHFFTAEMFLF